ncbi:MAG: hypothetical protein AAFP90_12175 [Planctomycetota bacterium]
MNRAVRSKLNSSICCSFRTIPASPEKLFRMSVSLAHRKIPPAVGNEVLLAPIGAAFEMPNDCQQGIVVFGIDFNCDSTGQVDCGRIELIGGRSGIGGHQLNDAAAVLSSLVSETPFQW